MKVILPLLVILFLASSNANAATEVCDRILTSTDPLAPSAVYGEYTGGAFCSDGTTDDAAACGVLTSQIGSRASKERDTDPAADCMVWIKLNVTTCESIGKITDVNGYCVDEPPDPCAAVDGVREFYECTAPTYSEAVSCAEGAVDSNGCYLDTTIDPYPPDCLSVGTPVSEGGTGELITCFVDLTGTGELAPPGHELPTVENDVPNDEIIGEETSGESTDPTGCLLTTSQQTNLTDNGDGTITRCTEIVETFGAGCADPGSDVVSETCSTSYSDGSSTQTSSSTSTDSSDVVTSSESSTGTTGSDTDIPEEGADTYSAGGGCEQPPSCSGDTLQCAIIEQQFAARCDFVNSVSDFTVPGVDPAPSNTAVDVDSEVSSFLGTSGWISNRSCPAVPSISVAGQSLTWSFEGVCEAFSALSFLILGFAGFTGIRVFMGAF